MSHTAQPELSLAGAAPRNLADILEPIEALSFLASDYGQKFRYIPGTPGKFSQLLPWPVLNRILEEHRLEPPRLRLTREGQAVPAERYLSRQANRRASGQPVPRLNANGLIKELREGSTLVLDAVDELHRPVRSLAESLERVFRVRVQVNAYAGWRTSHGFDLHWDDHDVFVLQVDGRKHWKVYGMTRKHPLARDIERAVDPPSEVLWDGMLESGDLLYIPRGWWHVASPLDEPTLHLTVGVNNLTGADFLTWFVDRLRAAEYVRRDIPHWLGSDALPVLSDRLRDLIFNEWHPGLIEDFLADMDAKSRPRPSFALPWTATQEVLPPDAWRVRWSAARGAAVSSNGVDGEITVVACGRRWRFQEAARPMLELLVTGRDCSLTDLEHVARNTLTTDVICMFAKELVSNGLIVVV